VIRGCARSALALAATACGGEPAPAAPPGPPALFERLSQELAPMTCGRPRAETILEVNGGGLALFDGDGDGDLDLLLVIPGPYPAPGVRAGGTNRLYRNDGGHFTDVTAGSGVDIEGFCNGVAVGDMDADGRRDLFITRLGPCALLRNLGELRFESVPDAAGAAGDAWATSADFVDVDRDGDLDLYVDSYLQFDPADPPMDGKAGRTCRWNGVPVMCGPQGLSPQPDRFWRNEGGRFRDATEEAGFAATASYGLGVIDGDWNGDGWPDVYVSNDSMANFLFLSRGDGSVREAGLLSGAALSALGRQQAGMGIAAGDAEGDGDEDLVVTNFSMEPNSLFVNRGDGGFRELGDPSGLGGPSRPLLGWGAAFLDADLDGDLDLVTANGHVYWQADAAGTGTSWAQPLVLYLNDGHGHFEVAPWPGSEPDQRRALAVGDIDDDGVPDLVIARQGAPPELWRGTACGPTLVVALAGRPGNPDGCGTTLRWRDAQGTRMHRVRTSMGFQAAGDPRAFFAWRGAGTLAIDWPDGRREERPVDAPGRLTLQVPAP